MSKPGVTIFYSWQSDDGKTRNFIEAALKAAVAEVARDLELDRAPRLDKDTQDEVGAVHIVNTIRRKIDECGVFLGDVSLIDTGSKGRRLVNQNVMFELGYAIGKKTEAAVMLVANSDLGQELPFDIAQNRVMMFSPSSDTKGSKLKAALVSAIRSHLTALDGIAVRDDLESALHALKTAINSSKPTRSLAESYFPQLYRRYIESAPPKYAGGKLAEYGEKVLAAYAKTLPLTLEIEGLLRMAAEYDAKDVFKVAHKELGLVAALSDPQPGTNYECSEDYCGLVMHELSAIFVGALVEYERWEDINKYIRTPFAKISGGIKDYEFATSYHYPESIKSYYKEKEGKDYAVPTSILLKDRFANDDRTLRLYVTGSLFLMLALDWYYPFVAGILLESETNYIPDFLVQLKSRETVTKLLPIMAAQNIDELRERMEAKSQQKLAQMLSYWNVTLAAVFKRAGISPTTEIGST